ncbi:uncharacterized protein EV420DRAFT_1638452 [Desarmillaria tabescens]|uniref:Uncharacterized protein n=1 Tax=Armillaria tabescens TaxID=1929756 RepID=A0AA39NDA3_ARMTA|nr:uncharacterized protein EV420DRAFT_1638452 [Desarmillaria tabescens]KAK0463517.1 hypothetical protein EV420DRAFT_1638452 [Desarmillaria tabescens]
MPAHLYNKPSWLLAPDPSTLPIPAFNGAARVTVRRQERVVVHATVSVPAPTPTYILVSSSHSSPFSNSCIFPPPPRYAEMMDMHGDLPLAEAMRRARAIDPIGYAAEVIHPEHRLPPSFDDIRRMEPHLSWVDAMKRADNIDQTAFARDPISQPRPEGLEALLRPSHEATSLIGARLAYGPTINSPERTYMTYTGSLMKAEEALTSLLFLSSTKDKYSKELKAFATFIAIWLHATVTSEFRTQPNANSARIWKTWSTFSEVVIVIQAIMEILALDYITVFHSLVYIKRLFGGCYIREDEAYLRNAPTIIARIFFVGCFLGFKYSRDIYSKRSWASAMDIDHCTVEKIGRHALRGLGYRLDISPNDWKISVGDLRQFAATCSFSGESVYTRTVVNDIFDKLEINSPPGIPLRARTGRSGQGTIEPPSFTDISGIFIGAAYIPTIVLQAAEEHPAAPWDIGQRIGPDEHLLGVSAERPAIWNGRNTVGGSMAIGPHMGPDTQFFSRQEASTWNGDTFLPSDDTQRIQPDSAAFFGAQEDKENDLTVRRRTAMMVGQRLGPDAEFLEMQRHSSASWSNKDSLHDLAIR